MQTYILPRERPCQLWFDRVNKDTEGLGTNWEIEDMDNQEWKRISL